MVLVVLFVACLIIAFNIFPLFSETKTSHYKIESDFMSMEKTIKSNPFLHEESVLISGEEPLVVLLFVPKELAESASDVVFFGENFEVEVLEDDPIIKLTPSGSGTEINFGVMINNPVDSNSGKEILCLPLTEVFVKGLSRKEKEFLLSGTNELLPVLFAEKTRFFQESILDVDFDSGDPFSVIAEKISFWARELGVRDSKLDALIYVFNPLVDGSFLEIHSTYPEDTEIKILDNSGKNVIMDLVPVSQGSSQEYPFGYTKYFWNGENESGELVSDGRYLISLSSKGKVSEVIGVQVSLQLEEFEFIPEEFLIAPKIVNVFLNDNTKRNSTSEPWCILDDGVPSNLEAFLAEGNEISPKITTSMQGVLLLKPFIARKLLREGKMTFEEQNVIEGFGEIKTKLDLLERFELDSVNFSQKEVIVSLEEKGVFERVPCLLKVSAELNEIPETEATAFARITPLVFDEWNEIELQVHVIKLGAVVSLAGKNDKVGELVAREHGWKNIVLESKPYESYFKSKKEFDFSIPVDKYSLRLEKYSINLKIEPGIGVIELGEEYLASDLELIRFTKVEEEKAFVEIITPPKEMKEKILNERKTAEIVFSEEDFEGDEIKESVFEGITVEVGKHFGVVLAGEEKFLINNLGVSFHRFPRALSSLPYFLEYSVEPKASGDTLIRLTLYPKNVIYEMLSDSGSASKETLVIPYGKEVPSGQRTFSFSGHLSDSNLDYMPMQPFYSLMLFPGSGDDLYDSSSGGFESYVTIIKGNIRICTYIEQDNRYLLLKKDELLLACIKQKLDTMEKSIFHVDIFKAKGVKVTSIPSISAGDLKKISGSGNAFSDSIIKIVSLGAMFEVTFDSLEETSFDHEIKFSEVLDDGRKAVFFPGKGELFLGHETIASDYLLEKTEKGLVLYYNKVLADVIKAEPQKLHLSFENPVQEFGSTEVRLKDIDFARKEVKLEIDNRVYPTSLVSGKVSYTPEAFEGEYDRRIELLNPEIKGTPAIIEVFSLGKALAKTASNKTKKIESVSFQGRDIFEKSIEGTGVRILFDPVGIKLTVESEIPAGKTGKHFSEVIDLWGEDTGEKELFSGLSKLKWNKKPWKAKLKFTFRETGESKTVEISEENRVFDVENKEGQKFSFNAFFSSGFFNIRDLENNRRIPAEPYSGGAYHINHYLDLEVLELIRPAYDLEYSGPKKKDFESILKGINSTKVSLPIDKSVDFNGKNFMLKHILADKILKRVQLVVDYSSVVDVSTEKITFFGDIGLIADSIPEVSFSSDISIMDTTGEKYRVSFLPVARELRQKVIEENEKESLSYLLILSDFFDLPAKSEVFVNEPTAEGIELNLSKKTKLHEEGIRVIDNLYYGNIDDDHFVELAVGRIPFSDAESILSYFRNLPVARNSGKITYAVYPARSDVAVTSERVLHQINLTGEFPSVNYVKEIKPDGYFAYPIKDNKLNFFSESSDMFFYISPTAEELYELIKDSGLFLFNSHGFSDSFLLTNSEEFIGGYFSSFVPEMINRPAIIANSCSTGIELSQAFIKKGASAYVGALLVLRGQSSYFPLDDELKSSGDEFKELLNSNNCYDCEHNSRFEEVLILLGDPVINFLPVHKRKTDSSLTYFPKNEDNIDPDVAGNLLTIRLPLIDLDAGLTDDNSSVLFFFLTEQEKNEIEEKRWKEFSVQSEEESLELLRLNPNGRNKNEFAGDKLFYFEVDSKPHEKISLETKNMIAEKFKEKDNTFFVLDSLYFLLQITEDKENYYIEIDLGQPIGFEKDPDSLNFYDNSSLVPKEVKFKVGGREFSASDSTTVTREINGFSVSVSYKDFFKLVEFGALDQPYEISFFVDDS